MLGWPARVVTVDVSRSLLPNSRVSSTTPVTLISPESPSMLISTLWAGVLAMRPCRLLRTVPLALNSGAPLLSRPQRQSSSSKPLSQPTPLGSDRETSDGWTGPFTGERQPSSTSPRLAFQMPMPRVGKTTNRSAPLLTSITSTPRLDPACRVRLATE